MIPTALVRASCAALSLFVSHCVCVSIVAYFDISGKWSKYALVENRASKTVSDYLSGIKSFVADLLIVFIPVLALCFYYRENNIDNSTDTLLESAIKFCCGYIGGKLWATGMHYALHYPPLYRFHRRHHRSPKTFVASDACRLQHYKIRWCISVC